jgi:hypothetical protein
MANDSKVVRQTPATSTTKGKTVVQEGEKNVLYKYRSVTYNLTFSGLRTTDANNPSSYRYSSQDLVIIKSGGKGTAGISTDVTAIPSAKPKVTSTSSQGSVTSKPTPTVSKLPPANKKDRARSELVAQFNKESPGRFDMYIENLEIDTVIEPTKTTVMTQPTSIKFDVIEPYSINGFLEAIQVAAVASGYPSYKSAIFLLKIQFTGYPDGPDLPSLVPEIEESTRYFPVEISTVEITLDERGTRYKLDLVPQTDKALGASSVLRKSVKISGKTVQEILENLMTNVQSQLVDDAKKSKNSSVSSKDNDEYRIKFPVWDPAQGFVDTGVNDIGKAKLVEDLKDNNVNSFPDAGTSTKPDAYDPRKFKDLPPVTASNRAAISKLTSNTNPVSQFAEGKQIQEVIESVIKDSMYVKNIAKKLSSKTGWKQVVDEFGMVNYFIVQLQVTNKTTIDPDLKRPYQIFTYVVTQRKILYTRFPNYGNQTVDATKLKSLSFREYNYIYTGQNLDVLKFNLKFDNLYYEAIPSAMGNQNVPPSKNAAGPGNKVDAKTNPDNLDTVKSNQIPSTHQRADSKATSVDKNSGGQPQADAYSKLAKTMHEAVADSKTSLTSGEIEILGDPFYVVTGGVGNYTPKPGTKSPRVTVDGEAAHNYGEVLITINFRNPADIQTLEQGGRLYFNPKLVPFSGVYRVNTVRSSFREGVFKQTLEIIRVQGQSSPALGVTTPPPITDPSSKVTESPNPEDQITQDTTPPVTVVNTDTSLNGDRVSTLSLANQLQRGLPSPGLPGAISNFTNATGGLGGAKNYLLSQVSGATSNLVGNSRIATQIFGGVIPGAINQLASGIPLQIAGVANLAQQILNPASLVSQVGNTALRQFGITNPTTQLAAVLIGKASQALNQISIPGSGIGAGSKVSYAPVTPIPSLVSLGQNVTAQDVQAQNSMLPTSLTAVTGAATGLNPNTISAVANLGNASAGLVNNVKSNVSALTQGITTDPSAIAQKFGVNASQLSGLSAPLESKILRQLSSIGSTAPSNTDLTAAGNQGINLSSLSPQGIANLPPIAPHSIAPDPAPDTQYIKTLSGSPTQLANAYGVTNIAKIPQDLLSSANLKSALLPTQGFGTVGNLLLGAVAGSKYLSGNLQLSNLVGSALSKEAGLSTVQQNFGSTFNVGGNLTNSVVNKFGSLSRGTSPLDKLNIQSSGGTTGSSDAGAG